MPALPAEPTGPAVPAPATPVDAAGAVPEPLAAPVEPAFVPPVEDPALPDVLLIGNSISIGYTPGVRELLEGVTTVHRPPMNCAHSGRGIEHIETWLGERRWDVIHVNWGLHDIKRMSDGRAQIEAHVYRENLERLLDRLLLTGATVIWASTTPVPDGELTPPRREADVEEYNAIAAELAAQRGVAVDDLHALLTGRLAELQRPADVHFLPEGAAVLARQVARAVRAALPGA